MLLQHVEHLGTSLVGACDVACLLLQIIPQLTPSFVSPNRDRTGRARVSRRARDSKHSISKLFPQFISPALSSFGFGMLIAISEDRTYLLSTMMMYTL